MSRSVSPGYAELLADRMSTESEHLAQQWLDCLAELLPLDAGAIFPSVELLDHIPHLICQLAEYLRASAEGEIAANTSVIQKAQELGQLRHQQRGSIHQILREYDVLADLLEGFVSEETVRLQGREVSAADCFGLTQRLGHAVRSLMQTTVDTFVSQYTATIAEQTARLESFNRMLMHELRTPLGTLVFAGELLSRAEATGDHDACMRLVALIRRNLEHLAGSVRGIERLVFAEPVIGGPTARK